MSKTARASTLRCSFCHKAGGKLIASPRDYPRAYICDECVITCAAIIEDDAVQARTQAHPAKEGHAVTSLGRVFVLQHLHVTEAGEEDVKFIGVYSTRVRAEEAVVGLIAMPGFRDTPEGFSIDEYPIDEDNWTSGYVTVYNGPE